ncbi:MAG TPA: phosphatidate cytidylyltransferase [Xanthobacteraceae bacterium]
MPDAAPPRAGNHPHFPGGQIGVRAASGLVLAAFALAIAYLGNWAFVAFWGTAAVLVYWEWTRLIAESDPPAILIAGGVPILAAATLAGATSNSAGVHPERLLLAVLLLALGTIATAVLARHKHPLWAAGGVFYGGGLALAPIVLRSDVQRGFVALLFLFAVVWATDIVAYFVGRALGGPKLAPNISPNKTWSGAIGGTAAAIAVALGLGFAAHLAAPGAIAALAAALSAVGQIGDLFESALKRRFGVKDSSNLIPGHGGLMDRLDAFVAAAVLAAVIGISRGGIEAPARGLLAW